MPRKRAPTAPQPHLYPLYAITVRPARGTAIPPGGSEASFGSLAHRLAPPTGSL
ncbi:MAG: hypothetical protein PHS52_06265 [Desulfotomaculaceae bacterium]|nr:hypothetical protein [Desulfotomaculaceae bacterium]